MSRSDRGRTEPFHRALSTLLDLKDIAHYFTALVNAEAQKKAQRASASLIELARTLLT